MKQPTFNWGTENKLSKLKNFKLEVINVLKSYAITDVEKKNSIDKELARQKVPTIIRNINRSRTKKCETSEGLFQTLSNKFKLRYNETIKFLQFHKMAWKPDENVEEWMGRLRISATECNYKEIDRQLKEQFMHGLNNSYMSLKIIRELTKNQVMKT